MNYQEMLETSTMAITYDRCSESDSQLTIMSQDKPISGYSYAIEDPNKSFKLIIWSEDFNESENRFYTTLDVAAVIRDDIDDLMCHVRGLDGKIVCKADAAYRKERDALRNSLAKLQVIASSAIADIDAQSARLEHDTKESSRQLHRHTPQGNHNRKVAICPTADTAIRTP